MFERDGFVGALSAGAPALGFVDLAQGACFRTAAEAQEQHHGRRPPWIMCVLRLHLHQTSANCGQRPRTDACVRAVDPEPGLRIEGSLEASSLKRRSSTTSSMGSLGQKQSWADSRAKDLQIATFGPHPGVRPRDRFYTPPSATADSFPHFASDAAYSVSPARRRSSLPARLPSEFDSLCSSTTSSPAPLRSASQSALGALPGPAASPSVTTTPVMLLPRPLERPPVPVVSAQRGSLSPARLPSHAASAIAPATGGMAAKLNWQSVGGR